MGLVTGLAVAILAECLHLYAQDKTLTAVVERLEAMMGDGRFAALRGHRTCGRGLQRGDALPEGGRRAYSPPRVAR